MILQKTSVTLLEQLKDIISQCRSEHYLAPLTEFSGSTFGQHVRHVLEFYLCLFESLESGVTDYDKRGHDKFVEEDKALAMSLIDSIICQLSKLNGDRPVVFMVDYSEDGLEKIEMNSCFYRELAYNIEHAIHHMAILKIGIIHSIQYIKLPPFFGIASSTIRFKAKNACSK